MLLSVRFPFDRKARTMTSTRPSLAPLDARIRLAALWTSTVFIVAFVDIFSFYRPDNREQIEAGRAFVFEIGQPFLLGIVLSFTMTTTGCIHPTLARAA